jgi:hypothetical protein
MRSHQTDFFHSSVDSVLVQKKTFKKANPNGDQHPAFTQKRMSDGRQVMQDTNSTSEPITIQQFTSNVDRSLNIKSFYDNLAKTSMKRHDSRGSLGHQEALNFPSSN